MVSSNFLFHLSSSSLQTYKLENCKESMQKHFVSIFISTYNSTKLCTYDPAFHESMFPMAVATGVTTTQSSHSLESAAKVEIKAHRKGAREAKWPLAKKNDRTVRKQSHAGQQKVSAYRRPSLSPFYPPSSIRQPPSTSAPSFLRSTYGIVCVVQALERTTRHPASNATEKTK